MQSTKSIMPSTIYVHYVYVMFNPLDNKAFYVGKGKGNRWKVHMRKSSLKAANYKNSTIKKIMSMGSCPLVIIVKSGMSDEDSILLEKSLIAHYGRKDNGTGILTNLTDGGDGLAGHRSYERTPAHKKAIGDANRGRKHSDEVNKRKGRSGSNNGMYGREKSTKWYEWRQNFDNSIVAKKLLKTIQIYNADGELQHTVHGYFSKFCSDNDLPAYALSESYRNDGAPIFTSGKIPPRPSPQHAKYKGWYAISLGRACVP